MAYDPQAMDNLRQRIMARASISPLQGGVANALTVLGGGKPTDFQGENLQNLDALNKVETGSPEFEIQKAQTLANIGVMKDLQTKRLERQDLATAANEGDQSSGGATLVGPTVPKGYSPPNSQGPSFVQGVGTPTPSTPDANDYETIQKPPVRKFNPQTGTWINEPQGAEVKPTLARETKEAAAKERGTQSGAVDPLLGTATGAMRGYIGRWKAMNVGNPAGAGRVGGLVNTFGGVTGTNANVKPAEGLKIEVATELAKIANPSGRGAQQTIDEFAKLLPDNFSNNAEAANKIHDVMQNAFLRYHSYKYGTPPTQQDVDKYESAIQDILNTPAAKQASMNGSSNAKGFKVGDKKTFGDGVTRTRQQDGTWQ